MRSISGLSALLIIVFVATSVLAQRSNNLSNPAIDMDGFLKNARAASKHREKRRLTEDQFVEMSKEPGVVILDARSKTRFDELHINGAINLNFSDITVDSLAKILPDKKVKILIYCNNNFENELVAFPTKVAPASLNLSTYITLYTYGYRNVYELGPLLNAKATKLELVSSVNVNGS